MNGLSDLFGSLQTMNQWQLLLAFVACIGYAFAQGSLLARQGRRLAWFTTLLAAIGFALESADWTHAIVLLGFGIAGMGSFVAMVWLTSHALGFRAAQVESPETEPTPLSPADARPRAPSPRDHAHST